MNPYQNNPYQNQYPTNQPILNENISTEQVAPETIPVSEEVQNITTSDISRASPPYALYIVALIVLAFFIKKLLEIWKRNKTTPLPAEDDGTLCGTCAGTGKVSEKVIKSAPCKHCKETGRDICHHCGGTGKNGLGLTIPQTEEEVQSLMDCDYCGGSGFPQEALACCVCKGKRKEEYTETSEVSCPTCKGSGRKK